MNPVTHQNTFMVSEQLNLVMLIVLSSFFFLNF